MEILIRPIKGCSELRIQNKWTIFQGVHITYLMKTGHPIARKIQIPGFCVHYCNDPIFKGLVDFCIWPERQFYCYKCVTRFRVYCFLLLFFIMPSFPFLRVSSSFLPSIWVLLRWEQLIKLGKCTTNINCNEL